MTDNGRVVRWFGTCTDIDSNKRAEEDRARFAEQESVRRTEAEHAQQRASFLAEASSTLTSSLDYVTTLASVAELAVPHFADMFNVDIVENQKWIRRVAMAHANPAKLEIERTLEHSYPPDLESPTGAGAVLRTGHPEWRAQVSDSMLYATARRGTPQAAARLRNEIVHRSCRCSPAAAFSARSRSG